MPFDQFQHIKWMKENRPLLPEISRRVFSLRDKKHKMAHMQHSLEKDLGEVIVLLNGGNTPKTEEQLAMSRAKLRVLMDCVEEYEIYIQEKQN